MNIDLVFHKGIAWFSDEDAIKGKLSVGQLADFAVDEDAIRGLKSGLTVVDGKIVYAREEFAAHDTGLPPVSPDWSSVNAYGGYHNSHQDPGSGADEAHNHEHAPGHSHRVMGADGRVWDTGCNYGV